MREGISHTRIGNVIRQGFRDRRVGVLDLFHNDFHYLLGRQSGECSFGIKILDHTTHGTVGRGWLLRGGTRRMARRQSDIARSFWTVSIAAPKLGLPFPESPLYTDFP